MLNIQEEQFIRISNYMLAIKLIPRNLKDTFE
jgi:hypothetical protein